MLSVKVLGDAEGGPGGGPRAELIRHLQAAKAKSVLIVNNEGLCGAVAQAVPGIKIIVRNFPDGELHLGQITPQKWVQDRAAQRARLASIGAHNVMFYTTNEPLASNALIQWHVETVQHAVAANLPLCILNLAVGAWQPQQYAMLDPLLRLLDQHRDLLALGLDEYYTAVPSSGMPRMDASGKAYFEIDMGKWPTDADETRWHVGRHQFILDYCDSKGIPRPRLFINETGADRLDEGGGGWVAQWLNSLKVSPGYHNIRSWRSCVNQWHEWYPGVPAQEALYRMHKYLVDTIWNAPYRGKSRHVEGVHVFCWWNSGKVGSSEDWSGFRVDNAPDYLKLVEQGQTTPPTAPPSMPVPPVPSNPPANDPRWLLHEGSGVSGIANVRLVPGGNVVGMLPAAPGRLAVYHIPYEQLTDAERARANQTQYRWLVVRIQDIVGWVRGDVATLRPIAPSTPLPKTDLIILRNKLDGLIEGLTEVRDELTAILDKLL